MMQDLTLVLGELEKLILATEIERSQALRELAWSDRAIAEKRLSTRRKALTMAVHCVRYTANEATR